MVVVVVVATFLRFYGRLQEWVVVVAGVRSPLMSAVPTLIKFAVRAAVVPSVNTHMQHILSSVFDFVSFENNSSFMILDLY